MAKETPSQGVDLISPDKIKKEPEEGTPASVSKSTAISKTITVLASTPTSSGKASTGQPKTILLVQTVSNRTGGIQSLLLPQALRNLPTTTSDSPVCRTKIPTLLTASPSNAGSKLLPQLSATPKVADCLLTSATGLVAKPAIPQLIQSQVQAQADIKSIVKLSSTATTAPQKVCELTFKSRTIQADGTVCTLKEYLCNFCQYKVASQDEFCEHFMTHVFSCNYCSFRAFTRYEVLSHKKEKHQGIAEELAGYEGLDSFSEQLNSIIAEWNTEAPSSDSPPVVNVPVPVVTTAAVSSPVPTTSCATVIATGETSVANESDSSPVIIVSPKVPTVVSSLPNVRIIPSASPVALLSTAPSTTATSRSFTLSAAISQSSQTSVLSTSSVTSVLVSQKKMPIVASTVSSSPVVLPVSTVKTTASIGKSNDNYFTYKIVHDAAGKVQAYECDVCSYRSTKINEIFAHASTHTLNDLMKSNAINVQWECFYCSFTSVLQANVVSHVIAKHPNKPIQLKRMVSNMVQRSTSRSVLLRGPTIQPELISPAKITLSPSIKKEKGPEEDASGATTSTATSAAAAATPTAAAASNAKKGDEADDGCMWGCYYCSVQSVDRNEIIQHLKKDHAQQKLVITRRRITHIPASQHSSKTDGPTEATDTGGDLQPNDNEGVASEKTNSDVQIGDIDSTDPQHLLLKSRRKQVFPRKVADDAKNDDAGEAGKAPKSSDAPVSGVKTKRRFQGSPKNKESLDETEPNQLDMTTRKRSRRSEPNVEEPSKKMKVDNGSLKEAAKTHHEINGAKRGAEETAPIVIDGQDSVEDASMPALEDISNFKVKPASVRGKHVNESPAGAEPSVVSAGVMSGSVNESVSETDKEMPVLQPEPHLMKDDDKPKKRSKPETGEKGESFAQDCPDDISMSDSQLFQFDGSAAEATCNQCSFRISGLNARTHMLEHCMAHTGGHLWTCPYCPFKCTRRSMIFRHLRNKHKSRSCNVIHRKLYAKSSENSGSVLLPATNSFGRTQPPGGSNTREKPRKQATLTSKLRGPRSVKEKRLIESGSYLWECPFCARRSLFKGSLRVHIKVAHPAEDIKAKLKLHSRTGQIQTKQLFSKDAVINIVPIESMHLYESLSTILLDNGKNLTHDLDIDDEVDAAAAAEDRNAASQKYQCIHCNYGHASLQSVKSHILQAHPGEPATAVNHRAGLKVYHLFMCHNLDCSFSTTKQELLKNHSCQGAEMEISMETSDARQTDKVQEATQHGQVADLHPALDGPTRLKINSKITESTEADFSVLASLPESAKSVDTSGSESRQELANSGSNYRKRLRTPEGPIDYNDDGTLKGVELENGSTMLQCRYCDYPRTSDPVEIKDHLASKHPRLQPIAIDVAAQEKGTLACLFVCSVFGCDYSSHYSNVFEHHMNLEHPDVESARLVKKKRTSKRISTDKIRVQSNAVPSSADQNDAFSSRQAVEESPAATNSKSSDNSSNKDLPLPAAVIASPAASTFSPVASSPVGTVSSDASNTFGDGPAFGSPDDVQVLDAPPSNSAKDVANKNKSTRRPRRNASTFDYQCRYECVQCSFCIGSPEEMKSHLVAKHRENFRSFYCIDRRARELRKRQKVLYCRNIHCSYHCKMEEELEQHEKYTCSFSPAARHQEKAAGQERVLQYMDSVMKINPGVAASGDGEKVYQMGGGPRGAALDDAHNKMYQCSHCTFITTDLHNIRMHVIAEHASTEGGFAEIKTELGTDGNVVMNVNDRGVNEHVNKSPINLSLVCDKNVVRESRSMYDAVDTVKIDDEEKVYTVL